MILPTNLSTEGYFTALLQAVRTAGLNVPLDPVILQSLLLCLVAPGGCKNLLLRSKEEDIGFVQNLTAAILAKVFGYTTQKVRTRPKQSVVEFLHSLFLHDNRRRQPSRRSARRSAHSARWSSSEPSELITISGDTKDRSSPTFTKQSTVDQSQRRPRVQTLQVQTNLSPPTLKDFESSSSQGNATSDQMLLPKAVVFSGLEHSGSAQRALLQILAEKRVVFEDETDGIWNLPEDFIIVYVCPIDPRERPKIHTSLLDRFAMSVTISPTIAVRQAYDLVRSEFQTPIANSAPIISPADLTYLRSLTINFHPSLSLHMYDLFTAARHHHELDGTLLTARAHKDAEALIHAQRLLCGDSTCTGLIRSVDSQLVDDLTEDSISDVYDDMRTVRASLEWFDSAGGRKLSGSEGVDGTAEEYEGYEDSVIRRMREREEIMDVSEIDIARIVPRVLSHRLRVRDGPDHEIFSSVLYPAASPDLQGRAGGQRKTIKEIMVKILSDT